MVVSAETCKAMDDVLQFVRKGLLAKWGYLSFCEGVGSDGAWLHVQEGHQSGTGINRASFGLMYDIRVNLVELSLLVQVFWMVSKKTAFTVSLQDPEFMAVLIRELEECKRVIAQEQKSSLRFK